jgi:hypothetical protein
MASASLNQRQSTMGLREEECQWRSCTAGPEDFNA